MLTLLQRSLLTGAILTAASGGMADDVSIQIALPNPSSLQMLDAVDSENGNGLISPLSVDLLIALARAGLDAGTPPADLPETVNLSYAVWFDTDATPTAMATAALTDHWAAHQEQLDLSADGKETINAWAKEATAGLIPTLISAPLNNANVVVTNALYFKDGWADAFSKSQTEPRPFTLSDGTSVDVPFMTGQNTYPSWETDDGLVVAMGFDAGGYVILRLPKAESLGRLVDDAQDPAGGSSTPEDAADAPVDPDAAGGLMPEDAKFVRVAMPVLDMKADLDLGAVIKALGLHEALAEGMTALVEGGALPGPVVQSVVFKADEDGVEAAAASAAIGVRSMEMIEHPLVVFDRSFDFFLMMPGHDTALIAGRLRDPR